MANPKRIYWDACVWIALIQQEKIHDAKGTLVDDRYGMCRNVINAASRGQIEIATSTLSFAEVSKESAVKAQGEDKIAAFFEVDYVLPVNLDRAVGERARSLMMAGYSKLKPADACHLASAALANAEEMHTYDDRLLALDGKIEKLNGTKLKICKPDLGGSPAPLLDAMVMAPAATSPPEDKPQQEPLGSNPSSIPVSSGMPEVAAVEPADDPAKAIKPQQANVDQEGQVDGQSARAVEESIEETPPSPKPPGQPGTV
jgi:predicted nucleic acid-binding protein